MSASERLERLNVGHEPVRLLPIARKTNTRHAGYEAFTRARDIEAVMDALPEIVAVVRAAEDVSALDAAGLWPELVDALAALARKLEAA